MVACVQVQPHVCWPKKTARKTDVEQLAPAQSAAPDTQEKPLSLNYIISLATKVSVVTITYLLFLINLPWAYQIIVFQSGLA